MSSLAEAIACISLYGILNCLLYRLSLPISTVTAIEGLALAGGFAVAVIGRQRIDIVNAHGGLTTSAGSIILIVIAGPLGAGVFAYLSDFGVVTVLISVLGIAVLSWFAGIISIQWGDIAMIIVPIAALPALVVFGVVYISTGDPALAMVSAVLIGAMTAGLFCWWLCSNEIWSLPIPRKLARHMAWGGAGAWAIFGAWMLTFAQLSPNGLHSRRLVIVAMVLSQATVLALSNLLSNKFRQTTPSENLALFMLVGSILGGGLGYLLQTI
ncbi:hypothetical protein [Nodosilinea sp. FACHB-13]|uniref:hypothetical protein n=1 Tax=Cyanophyceae TaxID=3028117 RepID=UPI0016824CAA|nr:hypothetical protein [Nodosilinea sp. FACHB-13]MBD2108796.1 hypothetical protein [Nodosilinea sp. FACHB-13]